MGVDYKKLDYAELLKACYDGDITRRQLDKLIFLRTGIKSNYNQIHKDYKKRIRLNKLLEIPVIGRLTAVWLKMIRHKRPKLTAGRQER